MNTFTTDLLPFFIHHWQLSIAFIAVLGLWIGFEFKYTFNGIPRLSANEATMLINREDPIILDVRDFNNFSNGHIQGATNIPIVDLPQGNAKLELHKNRKILLICQQGMQSGQAAQILHKQGFKNLVILKGGMQQWTADGMPIVKGSK
jgi:rhodanese-related sulfurtransferase